MGSTISRQYRNLCLALLSLLLLCSAHTAFMMQGRLVPQHPRPSQETEEKVIARAMIGSRPPRCQRRCAACGHCEAVQVPAVPQEGNRAYRRRRRFAGVESRGDDTTNYKPVSWKCKCGDIIVNP